MKMGKLRWMILSYRPVTGPVSGHSVMRVSIVKYFFGLIFLASLTGCTLTTSSRPIASDSVARGVQVVREMPAHLPSELSRIAGSQYLLVYAESGAVALLDNLIPLPFSVAGSIAGLQQDAEASTLKERYASVDPYRITLDRFLGSPLLTGREDALHLMPLVYFVEAEDGSFRPTLVLRIENGDWLGRYMYHLPTIYSGDQLRNAGPEVLASLRRELTQGAEILRRLMERDARGELVGDQRRVAYGSYYLVASRIAGMVSASVYTFPDAEILEEGADYVVLRSGGNLDTGAREGALAFGVHYFRKDQFHTYKVKASK